MPVITIAMDKATEEQKSSLVRNLTKTAAEITQKPVEHFTVFIQEFLHENIGQGGKTIKELRG